MGIFDGVSEGVQPQQLLLLGLINFRAFSEFDLNLGRTSSASIVAIAAGSIDLYELYYGGNFRFLGVTASILHRHMRAAPTICGEPFQIYAIFRPLSKLLINKWGKWEMEKWETGNVA